MADEKLPMNDIDQPLDAPVVDDQQNDTQEQREQRDRDEQGRFAPRGEPRGKPDSEAARRREAQERDHWKSVAETEKAEREKLNKRFEDMSSLIKGEDPNAPKQDDPLQALNGKVDTIAQSIQSEQERRQQEEAWNQVRAFADADEAEFRQKQPDFPHAVEHYIKSRLSEMQAQGHGQAEAEEILKEEARLLLNHCTIQRRSPSQVIFGMAQARGYQSGMLPSPVPQNGSGRPAGGRSFGTGSGPAGGGLTAQQIASMDDADYFALRNTPEGKLAIKR